MHTPTNSVACCLPHTHKLTHCFFLLFFVDLHFASAIRTISLELQLKLIFIELLCFLVYSFRSLLASLFVVIVVVVVCLPGIENSLRPLDIAPYDLLSKLSIALIIVAGTGTAVTETRTNHTS